MFEGLLDPIFSPLLRLDPFWSILIISVFLTFVITIIYKLVTDQTRMKELKSDMKSSQKKMKEHKNNPDKLMEIQKQAMEKNMEYMKQSFKPMLFTFIPIILIFGWLNAHLAFEPILPNQPFLVTAQFQQDFSGEVTLTSDQLEILSEVTAAVENGLVSWELQGSEGTYLLEFTYSDQQQIKEVLISSERNYAEPVSKYKNLALQSISLNNEKVYPIQFGSIRLSWLWTYILFSVISSIIIRKAMGVH